MTARFNKRTIQKALKSFNIIKFLKKEKIDYKDHAGGEIRICCPQCEDTKFHLYYNYKPNHHGRGLFICHKCNFTGNIIHLVSEIKGTSFPETLKIIAGRLTRRSVSEAKMTLESRSPSHVSKELSDIKSIHLPPNFKLLTHNIPYLRNRRITLVDIKKYGIGICTKGFYRDRIILPEYMGGKLVFWQARSILSEKEWRRKYGYSEEKDFKKVLNPKGSNSRSILGGYDKAQKYDLVVICEGFFDMMRVGKRAICLNGKKMSFEQFIILADMNPSRIAIMLDSNAKKEARDTYDLLKDFIETAIVHLPKDDPDSFKRPELRQFILDAFKKKIPKKALIHRSLKSSYYNK